MAAGSMEPVDGDDVAGVIKGVVSDLGLRTWVETEAGTDSHAAGVAEAISNATARRALFEDTHDAS